MAGPDRQQDMPDRRRGDRRVEQRRQPATHAGPGDDFRNAASGTGDSSADEWRGWNAQDVHGRGARQDRVDRGPTPDPDTAELVSRDYEDVEDLDYGGRDTAAYYARHGSNAERMAARRAEQAQRALHEGAGGNEGNDSRAELDPEYHLREGDREPGRHYAAGARGNGALHGRGAAPAGAELGSPAYGSSPTRERTVPAEGNHRGHGPRAVQRPDERIVQDLCDRLTEDPVVDASDVQVRCEDGKVILEGEVETRRMKHRTEDVVDACPGVRAIDNRLEVRVRGVTRAEQRSG